MGKALFHGAYFFPAAGNRRRGCVVMPVNLPHTTIEHRNHAGVNVMMKTLGFGVGAMVGPALLTGAILYASTPEAEAPMEEQTLLETHGTGNVSDGGKAYRDYGVVWTKL